MIHIYNNRYMKFQLGVTYLEEPQQKNKEQNI